MLVSGATTGSKARRRFLGKHGIRVAFFHTPVEEDVHVRTTRGVCKLGHVTLLRRALYATRQASWLWQKAVVRALKELDFVHLVAVACTCSHEAWDMAHGDDVLSESESEYQGMLDE